MHSLRFDPAQAIIHVTMKGFWNEQVLAEHARELSAELAGCVAKDLSVGILIDGRTAPVQNPEMKIQFQAMMATWPPSYFRCIAGMAIVSGTMLNRLQIMRFFGDAVPAVDSIDEGIALLRLRIAEAASAPARAAFA